LVGGSNFSQSQFNRVVQSNRQPGSAFKPLIFAVGLENKYTPASILLDSPAALGAMDDGLSWKPRNYDGKFKGTMTFRRALETSRNIPTIKLSQEIGVEKIKEFVSRLNMKVDLPPDLSISLGSFGMNLLNLVKMYSIFPNGGRLAKIKSILSIKDSSLTMTPTVSDESIAEDAGEKESDDGVDNNLEERQENPFLVNLTKEQVYDSRLAYIMTNLLKGVVQRGTGKSTSSISPFIGGKTGTTNNYVDAWFLGFSAKVVTGVWTGFDNNNTMGWGETGAKAALPIWREYMKSSLRKFGDIDFMAPAGIVNVAIDSESGKVFQDSGSRFVESFVEGTEPGVEEKEFVDIDQDNSSIILDGEDYYSAQ
jgi:penicillin-binding protein 1A